MELRDRIKIIRKDADLTQAEFSIKLGFAPTSAASWEKTDAQEPAEPIKLLICKTFGIREEWLRYGTGPMKIDNASELLGKLAAEHNLGPNQKALLSVAMEALDTLDDAACEILIDRLFAKIMEIKDEQNRKAAASVSIPSDESTDGEITNPQAAAK